MKEQDKKLVIFDFDGTLVDSMNAFADIAAKVMNRIYGVDVEEGRRLYIETSGLPFFQQLEEIFPKNPDNKKASNLFESEKLVGYFDQKVHPDAVPTIKQLKKKGIVTATSSNNFQHLVDEFIKRSPLGLDFVLGFREESFCKGRPHFQYLIDKTGLNREEMIFIGDSLKDAERAIDFDMDFIGKTGLFSKDDFKMRFPGFEVIDRLETLLDML